jgi:hypothetical protein
MKQIDLYYFDMVKAAKLKMACLRLKLHGSSKLLPTMQNKSICAKYVRSLRLVHTVDIVVQARSLFSRQA